RTFGGRLLRGGSGALGGGPGGGSRRAVGGDSLLLLNGRDELALTHRPVPLIPRLEASCWSSGSTMADRPVPERRRGLVAARVGVSPAAGCPDAPVSERSSVVSLTKGPSQG